MKIIILYIKPNTELYLQNCENVGKSTLSLIAVSLNGRNHFVMK